MKKAIKILLALTVMAATLAVVTVFASAADTNSGSANSNYFYFDRSDQDLPDYVLDISTLTVYMLPGEYGCSEFLFDHLPDNLEVDYISVFGFRADNSGTEDTTLHSGDGEGCTFESGEKYTLFYSNGYGCIFVADVFFVDELPEASSSSGNNNNTSSSGSGRFETVSGESYVYDAELLVHCQFGGYPSVSFLPVFFLKSGYQYQDFFYELRYYLNSSLSGSHRFSDFGLYDYTEYKIYYIKNGDVSRTSSGEVSGGLQLSEGTYFLKFSFACDCTECGDNTSNPGYSEFALCIYSVDTLPNVTKLPGNGSSDPGDVTDSYTSGYNAGFTDGYGSGYNNGFSKGEMVGYADGFDAGVGSLDFEISLAYDRGFGEGKIVGFNSGYLDGEKVGYRFGYDQAASDFESEGSARYQQGYQDALEVYIDTDGDAISGFFTGIVGSSINAFDYITRNIRIGKNTLFNVVEFVLFVVFCYFVVKFLISIFKK